MLQLFSSELMFMINPPIWGTFTGVRADCFSFGQKIFPFSNLNPLPFKPKENKMREENLYEMKEREESSAIFVIWEGLYNVNFNKIRDLFKVKLYTIRSKTK